MKDLKSDQLADLVAAVSDLRSGLGKLETKIGTSDEEGCARRIQTAIKTLPQRLDEHFDVFWGRSPGVAGGDSIHDVPGSHGIRAEDLTRPWHSDSVKLLSRCPPVGV